MIGLQPFIRDVYPAKAQFVGNEPVNVCIELENPGVLRNMRIVVRVLFMDELIAEKTFQLEVQSGIRQLAVPVEVRPGEADLTGYGLDVFLYDREVCLDTRSTAFDVVSCWNKSIRYGFLSHYDTADMSDETDLAWMRKLHLNAVQFYDWMYRHDNLIPPHDGEFQDLMGRTVNIDTVRHKIALCHRLGMRAIAYGAVYAASHAFHRRHPDWGLLDGNGNTHDFIGVFKIMNISPESPWHRHIIGQYRNAIEQLNFDGIHMDTYGFPKTALSRLNGVRKIERLDAHFPVLIDHSREELAKSKPDVGLIFNNVGNWPVDAVASSAQDAVYIEVWKPYERYHHIRELIERAKRAGHGKPVILAAYLQPFRRKQSEHVAKANYAALLLTAIIVSHGGTHLLLGENKGVLTEGYYVNHARLSDEFAEEIRRYYDFQVRYANLFYDGELKDVSMTHTDWDNVEYTFLGSRFSSYGQGGKVWTIIREKPGLKTVALVNLRGNDEFWNKGKNKPPVQYNLEVRMLIMGNVQSVFLASPDEHMGRPQQVPYRIEAGKKGAELVVTIPRLSVWSLLTVRLAEEE
ncbi:MAG TPA: glycoside hydrolase family 66 protein [Bacilli bacterium]